MPGTGVCPPAPMAWLGGKKLQKGADDMPAWENRSLALAVSGEDACASDQGASGQAGAPAWMLMEKH